MKTTMTSIYHQPPFVNELIFFAECAKQGVVFDLYGGDGTYGEVLLGAYKDLDYYYFDLDKTAVDTAESRLDKYKNRIHIRRLNCRYLDKRIHEEGIDGIDLAIYDPGLRREYVDNPKRGFVIRQDGPLDGRYDQSSGETIAQVIQDSSEEHLTEIFQTADVPFAGRVAEFIVEHRQQAEINSTIQLSDIAFRATPPKARRKNVQPGVLVMLALRMYVNRELECLKEALQKGFLALNKNGVLFTISYHSGEARIFKSFAKEFDERYAEDNKKRLRVLTRKAIKPTEDAIRENPLIRSAQLRVYEKLF
jgi:16S rRNA (cytosine1402-N4)-methyltransferase